jgi:hypothetical protein
VRVLQRYSCSVVSRTNNPKSEIEKGLSRGGISR